MIFYLFLRSLLLPITQVSHSGPLILLSLLLSIILPLFCSQMPSLHFPSFYTQKYTSPFFLHTTCSKFLFSPSLLPLFPFLPFLELFIGAFCYWNLSPPFHIILDCFNIHITTCMTHPTPLPLLAPLPTHFWMFFCVNFDYYLCVHADMPLLALSKENLTDFWVCNELLVQRNKYLNSMRTKPPKSF